MSQHAPDGQTHTFVGEVYEANDQDGRPERRVSWAEDCPPAGTRLYSAAAQPLVQDQYRLVNVGEVIEATDEVLDDDAVRWRPCPAIGRGMVYGRGYQPLRRKVAAACKYCGPGRNTGLPGGACENCLGTGLDQPLAADAGAGKPTGN